MENTILFKVNQSQTVVNYLTFAFEIQNGDNTVFAFVTISDKTGSRNRPYTFEDFRYYHTLLLGAGINQVSLSNRKRTSLNFRTIQAVKEMMSPARSFDEVKAIALGKSQTNKHGFEAIHDKQNEGGELAMAAKFCISLNWRDYPLSWDRQWGLKFSGKTETERYIIAGALLAAEIDRLKLEQQ